MTRLNDRERREMRDLWIGLVLLVLSFVAVLVAASFVYNYGG